jgi:hypothetical protein
MLFREASLAGECTAGDPRVKASRESVERIHETTTASWPSAACFTRTAATRACGRTADAANALFEELTAE